MVNGIKETGRFTVQKDYGLQQNAQGFKRTIRDYRLLLLK